MKFTEAHLELAFIDLLTQQAMVHRHGKKVRQAETKGVQEPPTVYGHVVTEEVLIKEELAQYLKRQYAAEGITSHEIEGIIRELEQLPASDLYESNKAFMQKLSNGFIFKREDRAQKDLLIHLIDYSATDNNTYTVVNQLAIRGSEMRIPDLIVYINGLPLVVFEFKSAIEENATLFNAYDQLTNRYRRDIPELFKYNAFCVISDGANTKAGSFFASYDFFYSWRRIAGMEHEVDGIDALETLIQGMFHRDRLRDIIHHFIYIPDSSKKNEKIVCRYPQYYAAQRLFATITANQKPQGNGKGGTYFGTTGCGKSYTMLYLTRLLMRSTAFKSPTIVLITDRTDLDDQLSRQFTNAKTFIGDDYIISVESRSQLRELLQNRSSGGVFLTTIHKFTEDTQLLTDRTNVICISDEAHRSQTNLNQKIKQTETGIKKSYGFAKHLHDSLPNATYVGFTGTPIDATIDVFGPIVDSYTMRESVEDKITVPLVYEGRAAKLLLHNNKLQEIEAYYDQCAEEGSNENQIEESKKAMSQMNVLLGDPSRITALANDFVQHYERRVTEKSSVRGKALFVCSSREIAYDFYKAVLALRPAWGEAKLAIDPSLLSDKERRELLAIEQLKLVMTRNKDDQKELYDLLGTKEYRKELDRQFKFEHSNFKIAIVVDMWLTGFDVPFLDTIYIDKPLQRHNLIQTISRVNRNFEGKEKGLVVDYIGIKKQMNLALAQYNNNTNTSLEEVEQSVVIVKNQLSVLANMFHAFNDRLYFEGKPLKQLQTLNKAAEFAQTTKELENRFMNVVKRLKAAFDICSGSELLTTEEKDYIHFYLAVRSIIFKLTKGTAPDAAQMNEKVRVMIQEAIESQGVEEIFKMGADEATEVDLFSEDYLAKLDKIKLPHTKFKLLLKLMQQAIDKTKRINRVTGIDFSKRLEAIVQRYNDREDNDILRSEVLEDFTNEIIELYHALLAENNAMTAQGIDVEEKAFYDILKMLTVKYDFPYPEERLVALAKKVKEVVDDKAKYTDWSKREDIKAELKVDLIILLADNDYPPIDRDEVYKEIFEQAENFKKYR